MKKIYAVGVAGLLMLGAASQASAAPWAQGDMMMSIYSVGANQEINLDLGVLNLSNPGVTQTLYSGLSIISDLINNTSSTLTSGIGIYGAANNPAGSNKNVWFASTQSTGTLSVGNNPANNTSMRQGVYNMQTLGSQNEMGDGIAGNGISLGVYNVNNGYAKNLSTTGAGTYSGMNLAGNEAELPHTGYVDMYLYQVNGNAQVGTTYEGVYRLTSAGDVTFTPTSAVPVPAAAWLLGSGLLGLAGLRRRKNS